jgi:quinoprotein glucose dehydrogenase
MRCAALMFGFALLTGCTSPAARNDLSADWPAYGRTQKGDRHSPLAQITPANVSALTVAWRYHTGELAPQFATREQTRLEPTPIVVDGTMYFATALGRTIALDAGTGTELWKLDPGIDRDVFYGDFVSRGVAFWRNPKARDGEACATRILVGVIDGRLLALDARTGKPCARFGSAGFVDLRQGLRNAPDSLSEYALTSPPAVVGDTVIVGSSVADNNRIDAASGEVRGFDAVTGALRWTWDPIPPVHVRPGLDDVGRRSRAPGRRREHLVGNGGRFGQ